MRLKLQKQSALKFFSRIIQFRSVEIGNNPAKGGGLNIPQLALGFHARDYADAIIEK
jgi:hypothetical protein